MKVFLWSAFAAAVIAQWAVPLAGVRAHERTLAEGVPVRLRCAAPDPYDLLRGRFLAVRLQPDRVPRMESAEGVNIQRGQPLYLLIEEGEDGVHQVTDAVLEKPADGTLFIAARAGWGGWSGSQNIGIEWPVDRFYLNEKLAPEADQWYAGTVRAEDGVIAELRVRGGRVVIEDLTYQGTPFREILRARQE